MKKMRAGAPLSARSYSSASSPDCDENETESLSTPTGPNFTTRLSSANAPARRNCSVSQAAVISRAWHTPPAGGSPAFARASRAQQRTWRATAFSTHTTNLPWYDLFTAVNTSAATRRPVKMESFSSLTMRIIQCANAEELVVSCLTTADLCQNTNAKESFRCRRRRTSEFHSAILPTVH